MATRKTKRYDEGGMAPEMGSPRGPDEYSPVGPSGGDPRGPLAAKLAGLMGGNKKMTVRPPQDQDGPANLAAMMGRTKEMRMPDRMPLMRDDSMMNNMEYLGPRARHPMEEDIGRPMPYERPIKGGKGMMGMPAMPPQDTPPERIIGEPMEKMPIGNDRPNPMVGALKNILANNMGRRGRNPGRDRAMGASMGGMAKGGSVSSASSRADGIAQKGKTRGKMC